MRLFLLDQGPHSSNIIYHNLFFTLNASTVGVKPCEFAKDTISSTAVGDDASSTTSKCQKQV